MWTQREIRLRAAPARRAPRHRARCSARCPSSRELRVGLLHLLIQHTSASLTLNENASPDVRRDLRSWLDAAVPEHFAWTHTLEGADDMPAHVKAAITGPSLTLPVRDGRLALGTWQGIYLLEHRDRGGRAARDDALGRGRGRLHAARQLGWSHERRSRPTQARASAAASARAAAFAW